MKIKPDHLGMAGSMMVLNSMMVRSPKAKCLTNVLKCEGSGAD